MPTDYSSEEFDDVRDYIEKKVKNGQPWEGFPTQGAKASAFVRERISEFDFPKSVTMEIWKKILESAKQNAKEQQEIRKMVKEDSEAGTLSAHEEKTFRIPTKKGGYWQVYRKNIESRFTKEDLLVLENSVYQTAKALRPGTQDVCQITPLKGLVIGHVQSGKTGHMGGLMAMAAHRRFNLIIVISGTILNLRKQTELRLYEDLMPPVGIATKTNWKALTIQETRSGNSSRVRVNHQLGVDNDFEQRNFIVSLKHTSWLNGIADWLEEARTALPKLNILIIDDEADQAGVNSKAYREERTAINKALLRLVQLKACSVNYVGYTATPAANILNEPPGKDSLYPEDYITSLPASKCYFGSKEIFGVEGTPHQGMDIVRFIPDQDKAGVAHLQDGTAQSAMPQSLKKSLLWFFCAAAAKRVLVKKSKGALKHGPTSMLIHTSQRIMDHQLMADSIATWLKKRGTTKIIEDCKLLWAEETKKFTATDFHAQYPGYSRKKSVQGYPTFSEIKPHISNMLSDVDHIELVIPDPGRPNSHLKPAWKEKKIHLCIDNSAPSGPDTVLKNTRLLYPDKYDKIDYPTAFLVIGGATLSRGLTIEGLISTYFLRSSTLEDSLMQMGRWFGYRVGYELLPRLWMTQVTHRKFRHMAQAEMDLRESLKELEALGISKASEYRLTVLSHPNFSWLRPTAKRKMTHFTYTEMDFAGTNNQTVIFENKKDWLKNNITVTEEFLKRLNKPSIVRNGRSVVWKGVGTKEIIQYIKEMTFSERARAFNNKKLYLEWMSKYRAERSKEGKSDNWSVIIAGIADSQLGKWGVFKGAHVHKVARSRIEKETEGETFSIGTLLGQADRFEDFPTPPKSQKPLSKAQVEALRGEAFEGDAPPQIIIYRISKDSKARVTKAKGATTESGRADLDVVEDVIGICVLIPGDRRTSKGNRITVSRTDEELDPDKPDIDDSNDVIIGIKRRVDLKSGSSKNKKDLSHKSGSRLKG